MRKALAVAAGAMVALVSTHGLVYSGIQMDTHQPMPLFTYQGFFEHILLASWRFWSAVHGWAPLRHAGDFGTVLAIGTFLICPLFGFVVFWVAARLPLGQAGWKPLAIAVAFTTPLQQVPSVIFHSTGLETAQAEAARALLVFLLMAWSTGAIRIPKREPSDSRQLATPFPRAAS